MLASVEYLKNVIDFVSLQFYIQQNVKIKAIKIALNLKKLQNFRLINYYYYRKFLPDLSATLALLY